MTGQGQSEPAELDRSLAWLREGTLLVQHRLRVHEETNLDQSTLLAGWSQGLLVAHLARNAEALGNLLHWAQTGIPTPMYPDSGSRSADMAETAALPVSGLLAEFESTASDLQAQLDVLPIKSWNYEVTSALGRTIPVSEVPWLRSREIWLHGVDLNIGITFEHLPRDLAVALVTDIVSNLSAKPSCPRLDLRSGSNRWQLGMLADDGEGHAAQAGSMLDSPGRDPGVLPKGQPETLIVSGDERLLVGWLAGRTDGSALEANVFPSLPKWI